MSPTTQTKVITLANGLTAKYTLTRKGQMAPCISDRVIVEAKLYLPTSTTSQKLHEDLCFGTRCDPVVNESIHILWGTMGEGEDEGYRFGVALSTGTTWKEAFAQAAEQMDNEVNTLQTALKARLKALQDAEN